MIEKGKYYKFVYRLDRETKGPAICTLMDKSLVEIDKHDFFDTSKGSGFNSHAGSRCFRIVNLYGDIILGYISGDFILSDEESPILRGIKAYMVKHKLNTFIDAI